ncbi:Homeobox-leucine zipper protein HDG1 [Platanthera guangdongensis]|uniref:Homeobox-leucine zipper protein HDG1 n=1 Tax=Platanthera guangdongensis TaxID=2320717 RepID=A0ABR2MZ41_9ASPA
MSFGGLFDGDTSGGRLMADLPYGSSAMAADAFSQPLLVGNYGGVTKPMFGSTGLSLGLQSNMEGQGEFPRLTAAGCGSGEGRGSFTELAVVCCNKEDENDSKSGSDNMEGGSGDELDENPRKKKRYHRHTPNQIQELEGLFKECAHPDEKQRLELSRRLGLETRQVKFWFQNRRTQMKTQLERHENTILRQENDKLRSESISIRDAIRNPTCSSCGGPAVLGEVSLEEQHLRIENARLKDELDRVCTLAGKFLGRPISTLGNSISTTMPSSSLELAVGGNGFGNFCPLLPAAPPAFSAVSDYLAGVSSPLGTVITPPARSALPSVETSLERSMLLELALSVMDELVKMAEIGEPLWIPGHENGKEVLNYEHYEQAFPRCVGLKEADLVSEATRETAMVIISSLALVETLMDSDRWADMFPGMIARTTTTEIISNGMGGTRNGALQLMHAELQVLSPLVPIREVSFLRFCKQLADGAWAVVDVSVDGIRDNNGCVSVSGSSCRRLPSGCVVLDVPNGYSKVTWVEHAEYDEKAVHRLYRMPIRSGMALGAGRWVATLQRQCECLAILMSSAPNLDHTTLMAAGRRSMLKLAQRMTDNFCAGVCPSSSRKWSCLANMGSIGEDMRVMSRTEHGRPRRASRRCPLRRHLRLAPHLPSPPLRLPPRRDPAQPMGHPLQRRPNGGDCPYRKRPAPRQRRLPPPRHPGGECEPEQHADTAGDVHRPVGLDGGLRSGGRASNAPGDERRRLVVRGAAAFRICRNVGWAVSGGRRGEDRQRVAAHGGVSDTGGHSADGEADGGVGGDGQQSDILHGAEDQGRPPVCQLKKKVENEGLKRLAESRTNRAE